MFLIPTALWLLPTVSGKVFDLFLVDSHFIIVTPLVLNDSELGSLLLDIVLVRRVSVVFLVYVHKALGSK